MNESYTQDVLMHIHTCVCMHTYACICVRMRVCTGWNCPETLNCDSTTQL